MENIKNKFDDLSQKIRPGTTWVSGFTKPGNNDDLRSIDSEGTEMRFVPVSRYYASCKIKRGQALSIAQLNDLTIEQKQNKYAYVKITDPDIDENCIGVAMNYAEEGQVVHIQSTGKFNYNTTDSILYTKEAAEKEIFLNANGWKFDNVRGQKLFIKKLYNNRTNAEITEGNKVRPSLPHTGIDQDENGDYFDTDKKDQSISADTDDWFTYDFLDSIYNVKNTIQIGHLTDAPTTNSHLYIKEDDNWTQILSDGTKSALYRDAVVVEYNKEQKRVVTSEDISLKSTGISIPKGSTPPKAHEAIWLQFIKEIDNIKYYSAVDDLTVTIELEVTGDTRGPIDNTQFLLTLGETIYFDTKKQDPQLTSPHYNNGIYDELKVVAIAQDKPTGPCFRCFLTTNGTFAYEKATAYESGKKYYARYPGNVFKQVNDLDAIKFNNTFEAATVWLPEIDYYTFDEETKKYSSVGLISPEEFSNSIDTLFYKIDFYTEATALDYAFIGLRKIDGDTYLIPVLCNFTEKELANGSVFVDVNDEGYYKLTQQFNSGIEQEFFNKAVTFEPDTDYYEFNEENNEFVLTEQNITDTNVTNFYVKEIRKPKTIVGEPLLTVSRESLKEAISKGLQNIFVNDETRLSGCRTVAYNIGDEGFQILTREFGGSYDIYVSSNLLSLISVTQVKHGQSAEPGTAILADIRNADRLNVVGVVLSNQTGVHKAGETIKVMRMGRITTLGNLLPGREYFLGFNGRITTRSQYWYDHCVPIGLAESANYFIVDVSQYPQKDYSGNFPLGYLKPSIYGMAEKGFVLADGHTVYNKDEFPELYNLLLNWFNEEELKPTNVSENLYNKYEKWALSQVFTDIFNKLSAIELFNGKYQIELLTDKVLNLEKTTEELEKSLTNEKIVNTNQDQKILLLEDASTSQATDLQNLRIGAESTHENLQTAVDNLVTDLAKAALRISNQEKTITAAQDAISELTTVAADNLTTSKEYTNTEIANKLSEALVEYVKSSVFEANNKKLHDLIQNAEESEDIENLNGSTTEDLTEANRKIQDLDTQNKKLNDTLSTLETLVSKMAIKIQDLENKINSNSNPNIPGDQDSEFTDSDDPVDESTSSDV